MHIYIALAILALSKIIPTGLNAELLYPNQKAVENAVGETQTDWSCPWSAWRGEHETWSGER